MSHTLTFFFLLSLPLGVTAEAQPWITAYFLDGSMQVTDIPMNKVTHIVHWGSYPSDAAGSLTTVDSGNADALTALAHQNGVKVLFCVRDNNSILSLFSAVLRNNLHGFINNIAAFVQAHNYDGVDLDWEAGNFDGPVDQTNYVNLLIGLKNALGPGSTVTMSVYMDQGLQNIVQQAVNSIDQVNVMCYDMDQYNKETYFNSATYTAPGDLTHNSCSNLAAKFAGRVPASKIGLGIPFYGRIWNGCSDFLCNDGLHDPGQTYYGNPSQKSMHYNNLVASSYWSYPHNWDATHASSWISVNQPGAGNDRFISFTDAQQILAIVQLMQSAGYGGVMEFELDYELIPGASGDAAHPLTSAVYSAIFGSQ